MRSDGKRVKNADPMYTVGAYVMDKRLDSMNMITVDIPLAPLKEYIAKMKEHRISHMPLIICAFLRTMCEFPELNRFVVNKKIYQRNDFSVSMAVLKPGDLHGTTSKVSFDFEDTIFDVQRKIDEYVAQNRAEGQTNSADYMVEKLLSVPGLCNFGVGLFKFMDKHGILPKKVIDLSPFHASFLITNLASIRTNHIYHHIYEFGTTSMAISIGNIRYIPKMRNEQIVFEQVLPLGITMDERICSGAYFAAAFKRASQYLKNPHLLEEKGRMSL